MICRCCSRRLRRCWQSRNRAKSTTPGQDPVLHRRLIARRDERGRFPRLHAVLPLPIRVHPVHPWLNPFGSRNKIKPKNSVKTAPDAESSMPSALLTPRVVWPFCSFGQKTNGPVFSPGFEGSDYLDYLRAAHARCARGAATCSSSLTARGSLISFLW